MKTFLFLFVLAGLADQPDCPPDGPNPPDSLNRTRPDTTQRPRPDSVQAAPPAVRLTGELTLASGFYAVRDGETSRGRMTPRLLTGSLTLITRSGWTVPVQVMGSSQNDRSGQPYNQIGGSPRYQDWLMLHGGYRNVVFSPLTLAGHTFLGAGVELNPGLLRMGFVAGRFNRAIDAHADKPDQMAQFRRLGYSARLGLGNSRNYLDLILLRVADQPYSIRSDSLTRAAPAENAVLGLSGRLHVYKKLAVEFDAAGSAYNHDFRSEARPTATGQSGWKRYVNWLTNRFINRPSSRLTTALKASLSYRLPWADLKLQYRRIEPDYRCMGAYYFPGDREAVTVTPALRLLGKRLYVRTSVGWQRDNLLDQKKARTDRLIGSVNASYLSAKGLTIDLAYANHGLTQRAGYRPLSDTIRLAQNNRTLSVSAFKLWAGKSLMHTLTGSAAYQALRDKNAFTAPLNQYQNQDYSVSYAGQHRPAGLDLNVSYQYTRTSAPATQLVFGGPSVGLGKKLLKDDQLSLVLTVSYQRSREVLADFSQRGSARTTALNVDYRLTPVHRLSVNWTDGLNRGNQTYRQQHGSVQWSASF